MSSLADLTIAQSAFRSALIEAMQRTALILPDHWRWLQFESVWVPLDVTYNAANKLTGYKLLHNASSLTVVILYNSNGDVSSMQLTSMEGTITLTPSYDASLRLTANTVTFS